MLEGYQTIGKPVWAEQTIDKSRFIAYLVPVADMAAVRHHMEEARRLWPDARHYVYAYRLREGKQEKASDDGEPQGTGGKPVLNLLQNHDLWDVLAVVVRYFGGILLGTGGLTRAYGGTARLALGQGGIVRFIPHQIYRLCVPYSWFEKLSYQLQRQGIQSSGGEFLDKVYLEVYLPLAESASFETWLSDYAGGQIAGEKLAVLFKLSQSDNSFLPNKE